MKLPESIAEWKELISLLESSVTALQDSDIDLKTERSKLSLAVAMGDEAAIQAAERMEMSGCRLALERQNNEEALAQAKAGLAKAEEAEAERLESERQRKLAVVHEQQRLAAEAVDSAMANLISAAWTWLNGIDDYRSLGEQGHGRRLGQKLQRALCFAIADSGLNRVNQSWKVDAIMGLFGDTRVPVATWEPLRKAVGVE